MRFAVLFLTVLVLAGALYVFVGGESRTPSSSAAGSPAAPITLEPAEQRQASTSRDQALGAPEPLATPRTEDAAQAPAPDDADPVPFEGFSGKNLVNFQGSALLQPKGQRPYSAVRGTLEFAVLHGGRTLPVIAKVSQGRFSVELPNRCRISAKGGRLEEQPVRILGGDAPFTLDANSNYAFVGEPIPVQRLRVFGGAQRVPLTGVTVSAAADGVTAIMGGVAHESEAIVEDAASPIELPYMESKRPVWLHVSAEGYATTAQLLDPQKPGELDVTLWPSATLTVRVTGPLRDRLTALILHRHEPRADGQPPRKRHFATFRMNTPGITKDTDATIFSMEDVPALPLTIDARGLDKRGRERILGTTSVELTPNQAGRVELRLVDQ